MAASKSQRFNALLQDIEEITRDRATFTVCANCDCGLSRKRHTASHSSEISADSETRLVPRSSKAAHTTPKDKASDDAELITQFGHGQVQTKLQPMGATEKTSLTQATMACDACQHCQDVCNGPSCQECAHKRCGPRRTKCGKPVFTPCEIRRHNKPDDCWIYAHNVVYDVTPLMSLGDAAHPGGLKAILRKAGTDVSRDFDFHSRQARKLLWKRMAIGVVETCKKDTPPSFWKFWTWAS